ncbi:hypothetical protein OHA27_22400 [Streptomyces sp. NBC_01619]|uniref:DUF6542 domain-containing protein n=1 Tax=unclassified Streptomyces TaxID=2593676 RepID=UPI00225A88C4|nr:MULTISPECIES: DUF6542 domain-containing protein [unclassified Streptomyces]MCX4513011.1 hypothetical protein [Streptomyces sp. NBC_01619]
MEQQRTGTPSRRPRPQAPLSPQAPVSQGSLIEGAAVYRVTARPGRPGQVDAPARPGKRPTLRPVRPGPPVLAALRRLPNPRLTGLGAGLFACSVMLVLGSLDELLFDGSAIVYGVLFLPLSALTAFWVRDADLVTAPISVPIAFATGLVPISGGATGTGGSGGIGVQIMALVTALAVHAGWLYGGTLIAGVIASVRKIRLMTRRRSRRPSAPPRRA